ncbi:hypothetical protein Q8A73_014140 [Channa argus]|nr:hypothetical protein Q8A73_014140 [Channa argus]
MCCVQQTIPFLGQQHEPPIGAKQHSIIRLSQEESTAEEGEEGEARTQRGHMLWSNEQPFFTDTKGQGHVQNRPSKHGDCLQTQKPDTAACGAVCYNAFFDLHSPSESCDNFFRVSPHKAGEMNYGNYT